MRSARFLCTFSAPDPSDGSVSLAAGLFDAWKSLDLTEAPLPTLSTDEVVVKSDTVDVLVRLVCL